MLVGSLYWPEGGLDVLRVLEVRGDRGAHLDDQRLQLGVAGSGISVLSIASSTAW